MVHQDPDITAVSLGGIKQGSNYSFALDILEKSRRNTGVVSGTGQLGSGIQP